MSHELVLWYLMIRLESIRIQEHQNVRLTDKLRVRNTKGALLRDLFRCLYSSSLMHYGRFMDHLTVSPYLSMEDYLPTQYCVRTKYKNIEIFCLDKIFWQEANFAGTPYCVRAQSADQTQYFVLTKYFPLTIMEWLYISVSLFQRVPKDRYFKRMKCLVY